MWYICEKRKMKFYLFLILLVHEIAAKNIITTDTPVPDDDDNFDNNIIDFDEDYSVKYDRKYNNKPSSGFNKESHKYTIVNHEDKNTNVSNTTKKVNELNIKQLNEGNYKSDEKARKIVEETTPSAEFTVLPIELLSTTDYPVTITDDSTKSDLGVIPLSTTKKSPELIIKQTVILPSTQSPEFSTEYFTTTSENVNQSSSTGEDNETTTSKRDVTSTISNTLKEIILSTEANQTSFDKTITNNASTSTKAIKTVENTTLTINNDEKVTEQTTTVKIELKTSTEKLNTTTSKSEAIDRSSNANATKITIKTPKATSKANESDPIVNSKGNSTKSEDEVPTFTELDTDDVSDVPEDYYDAKDVVPTTAPKTDALSVIFGLAGSMVESVVESVAEKVVPKGIYDLFKRMQKQNEALEAERLRSREENGGIGQFTRGILRSISSGLSKPLSQLMSGAKDIGSLDTDRGFVSSVATGVTSVANGVVDAFKDRVQAIYPGTVWCGDGHSAAARSSSDLGLFFFTDVCCRQHDACKIYIPAGETKYGLTNTGLFTRSHCSCDLKFRECLQKTNSLVSAQIGLTYFNVLGPQCFRKAHPIVRCLRRTRITGQKCEEYELDYTKPKMWQWFDNETF